MPLPLHGGFQSQHPQSSESHPLRVVQALQVLAVAATAACQASTYNTWCLLEGTYKKKGMVRAECDTIHDTNVFLFAFLQQYGHRGRAVWAS